MTDYLIDQYNEKITAALKAKDDAIAGATQIWHKALDEIMGVWQAASVEALIEYETARAHRDKVLFEGPPATTPAEDTFRPLAAALKETPHD